ncbi:MAG: hypothetical protein FJ395_13310 [Verrucomicrobia bacterium]|nr:hypothetical protein [Verrucomicrobiota bacterium]
MARPIRVEFPGAVYHVMARGNEYREVFRDEQDRKRFLETVEEMVERFSMRVHAFVLMPNHYHMIAETSLGNLSQAVGWLQVTYTVRFNKRWKRVGHLFQGRFKAQLVEADEYGQWLVKYIHLNPVRPKKRGEVIPPERWEEFEHYAWSSHPDYAGLRTPAKWLSLDWRQYWGSSTKEAIRAYQQDMCAAFGSEVENRWGNLRSGLALCGESFWERVSEVIGRKKGKEEARWTTAQDIKFKRQQINMLLQKESDTQVKIWVRVKLGAERPTDLAREFGYRDCTGILRVVQRLESLAEEDKAVAAKLVEFRCACKAPVC